MVHSVNKKLKMKPLPTTQRVLIWLCVCPDKKATKWQQFAHITFTILNAIVLLSGTISSLFFTIQFVMTNLEDTLYAIAQIAGGSCVSYNLSVAYIFRYEINAILDSLSKIYDFSKTLVKLKLTKVLTRNSV